MNRWPGTHQRHDGSWVWISDMNDFHLMNAMKYLGTLLRAEQTDPGSVIDPVDAQSEYDEMVAEARKRRLIR